MANQEKEDLVLDLPKFLNPSAVESFSDDIISSDVLRSVIPPPRTLTSETDTDDVVADALVPVDGHVTEEDDDGVVVRILDDSFCRQRMVSFGEGSRYSIGDCINHDGDTDDEDDYNDLDDEDDYDDLDDELVPRSVSKKLKRQRMRKLGKRCSSYSQLKPGCVRGKHGFGINFRC
ncbi:PREDICTED: pheromone-processing carboxypeptidase KEX1-like [Camelina sativa]|uniref:Pheromone-processing carboxypeptidase KEX1-like n=1 Tax=Camelina sativa TaxID=90675 RepID=A0ABM1R019_CAMSA|nr:PREDICTED: pheromone-processing carboxypeptidase KEX1-like [Camelina sativa]